MSYWRERSSSLQIVVSVRVRMITITQASRKPIAAPVLTLLRMFGETWVVGSSGGSRISTSPWPCMISLISTVATSAIVSAIRVMFFRSEVVMVALKISEVVVVSKNMPFSVR